MLGKNMLEMHNALNAPRASITDEKWVRPESWIDLSDCPEGSIYMMVANWYDEGATICFRAQENTGGPILIDWGDETVEEFQNSSLVVSHTYQAGDGEWIGEGFLGLKVTITPVIAGRKISYFSVESPYDDSRLNYYSNIVSVYINSSGLSSLSRAFGAKLLPKVFNYLLKDVTIVNAIGLQDMEECFANCINLRKAQIDGTRNILSKAARAFYGCTNLTDLSLIDLSKASVDETFYNCASIKKFPKFDFGVLGKYFNYTFYGCSSVENFSDFPDLPSVSCNYNYCFSYCTSLKDTDGFPFENASILDRTFKYCTSLQRIGDIEATICESALETFMECTKLYSVGDIHFPNAASLKSLFYNCYSLCFVGAILAEKNTTSENMFISCYSLINIYSISMPLTTISINMFYSCRSIQEIPILDFKPVTANLMFYNCNSLKLPPDIDFSNLKKGTSLFENCFILKHVPTYNFSSNQYFTNMFSTCYNLESIPHFNYSGIVSSTGLNNMIYNCEKLTGLVDYSACPVVYSQALDFSTNNLLTGLLLPVNFKHNCNLSNCSLDAAALNALFTGLTNTPSTTYKTITITGNPGAATCDRSIATNKGWIVVG